jgi:hypothetical protein
MNLILGFRIRSSPCYLPRLLGLRVSFFGAFGSHDFGTLLGNIRAKVCLRALGIPFSRHPDTEGALMPKISATAHVPPSLSIMYESFICITFLFMSAHTLG